MHVLMTSWNTYSILRQGALLNRGASIESSERTQSKLFWWVFSQNFCTKKTNFVNLLSFGQGKLSKASWVEYNTLMHKQIHRPCSNGLRKAWEWLEILMKEWVTYIGKLSHKNEILMLLLRFSQAMWKKPCRIISQVPLFYDESITKL